MSWHPEVTSLRQIHFEKGGLTRWIIPKLGYDAIRLSTDNNDKSEEHVAVITRTSMFSWKFAKVRIDFVYVSNALKHFKCFKYFKYFKRFKRVERFYTF